MKHRTDPASDPRRDATRRLRALADALDENPDLPLPTIASSATIYILFAAAEDVRALVRAARGRVEKTEDTMFDSIEYTGEIAPGLYLSLSVPREQVCDRIVVGTETVEVPDPDAPLVQVERDVVEWRCRPILETTAEGRTDG